MFNLHLIFWLVEKASKVPLGSQKEFIYLTPNTYCPGNCVYTGKLLGKHKFSKTAKKKITGPLGIITESKLTGVKLMRLSWQVLRAWLPL